MLTANGVRSRGGSKGTKPCRERAAQRLGLFDFVRLLLQAWRNLGRDLCAGAEEHVEGAVPVPSRDKAHELIWRVQGPQNLPDSLPVAESNAEMAYFPAAAASFAPKAFKSSTASPSGFPLTDTGSATFFNLKD